MASPPGFNGMLSRRLGARGEYRLQERQRANDSTTIAEKFPQLKSLTVQLSFSENAERGPASQIVYRVNLANARSVFRFDCPNGECIGGDFELSRELTDAYSRRLTTAVGEALCQGWRSKTTVGTCRCEHRLRYSLTLEYEELPPVEEG